MSFDCSGALEIECDAPAYSIVQSCWKLGLQAPEDVRWCPVEEVPSKPRQRSAWLSFGYLKSLFARTEQLRSPTCVCGAARPKLQGCWFTFFPGKETQLLLGQCHRCKTIFWKEVSSGPE